MPNTCPKCGCPTEVVENDPDVGIEGHVICTNEQCDWFGEPDYEGDN